MCGLFFNPCSRFDTKSPNKLLLVADFGVESCHFVTLMENQDVSSPTKRPYQLGNNSLSSLSELDHDNWDACSYILENCPDVIQDIESSLSRSKDGRSTRVLLGWDCDLPDNEDQEFSFDSGQFTMEPKIDTGQSDVRTQVKLEEPEDLVQMEGITDYARDSEQSIIRTQVKLEEPDNFVKIEENRDDATDEEQSFAWTEVKSEAPENLFEVEEKTDDASEAEQSFTQTHVKLEEPDNLFEMEKKTDDATDAEQSFTWTQVKTEEPENLVEMEEKEDDAREPEQEEEERH